SGSGGYRPRGASPSGPRSGIGGSRSDFRKGYDSDKFERGLREFKEVTREIGREVMDAIRSETWFGGRKNRNELIIPDHRGDGSNENRDKQVERQWDRVLEATPRSLEDEQYIVQEYRQQT